MTPKTEEKSTAQGVGLQPMVISEFESIVKEEIKTPKKVTMESTHEPTVEFNRRKTYEDNSSLCYLQT